jgi:hypothetical protein
LGLFRRVKALLVSSPRELTEVIVDSSGSSREKGLNDSPSEVSEEASGTSKEKGLHYSPRELGEVVVTIPAQVDSARG